MTDKILLRYNIRKLEGIIEDYTDFCPDLSELENTSITFVNSLYNILEESFSEDKLNSYESGYEQGVEDSVDDFTEVKDQGREELLTELTPQLAELDKKLGEAYNAFDDFRRKYRNDY